MLRMTIRTKTFLTVGLSLAVIASLGTAEARPGDRGERGGDRRGEMRGDQRGERRGDMRGDRQQRPNFPGAGQGDGQYIGRGDRNNDRRGPPSFDRREPRGPRDVRMPRGPRPPIIVAPPRGPRPPVVVIPPRGHRPPVVISPPRGGHRPPVVIGGGRHHNRRWDQGHRSGWQVRIGSNPRWNRHNGRWNNHWSVWDSRWQRRQNVTQIGVRIHIDNYRWGNYWHNRYNRSYIYTPPYPYEDNYFWAESDVDYDSNPAPHFMEADVDSFLNLRSSPFAMGESNLCGQLPAGAVIPVASVVRTEIDGMPWAMIPIADVDEFIDDSSCFDKDYVFAAFDYLK